MVEMANNSNQTIKKSKRRFRKLPLLGGIINLYFCFFATIPLGLISNIFPTTLSNIPLTIMSINQLEYYIWGILDAGTPVVDYSHITIETLIPLSIWLLSFIAGVFGLMGSSYNADPKKMKRLIMIAAVFLIVDLAYFCLLYFFIMSSPNIAIGSGFYVIIICMVFYILGAMRVTEYREN